MFGLREKWMNKLCTIYEIILILIQPISNETISIMLLYSWKHFRVCTISIANNIQINAIFIKILVEICIWIKKSHNFSFLTKFNRCFATNSPWPILYVQNENVIDSVLSKMISLEYRRWTTPHSFDERFQSSANRNSLRMERIHSHWDEVQAWDQFWMESHFIDQLLFIVMKFHILTQTFYSPMTWNHIVAHYRERDEIDR